MSHPCICDDLVMHGLVPGRLHFSLGFLPPTVTTYFSICTISSLPRMKHLHVPCNYKTVPVVPLPKSLGVIFAHSDKVIFDFVFCRSHWSFPLWALYCKQWVGFDSSKFFLLWQFNCSLCFQVFFLAIMKYDVFSTSHLKTGIKTPGMFMS